jgi:hypothetical protein
VHSSEEMKKDGGKAGDKSSIESLETVREHVGMSVPQRTASVPTKKASGHNFNDIIMTREWELSEAYGQDGDKQRHGSYLGAARGQ